MKEHTVYRICESKGVNHLHLSYGIALYRSGRLQRVIDDISPDRTAVEALVRLFNEEGLDPVHFEQATEDYLYDFTV